MEVGQTRQLPGTFLGLVRRRASIGAVNRFQGAFQIAEQHTQTGRSDQTRKINQPHIQRPLRGDFGLAVIALFAMGIDEHCIDQGSSGTRLLNAVAARSACTNSRCPTKT